MSRLIFLWLLLLTVFPAPAQRGAGMVPEDFAWGLTLTPVNDRPFYAVELPLAIYRGVQSDSLVDVRVFNAQGEVVPHELRLQPLPKNLEQEVDVPLFPIYARKEASAGTLTLKIQKKNAEGLVSMQTREPLRSSEEVLRAYVIRLPELIKGEHFSALELDWPAPSDAGFVQIVQLESSPDLENWRTWYQNITLVDLRNKGDGLRKNTLSLVGITGRYLRISSRNGNTLRTLDNARLKISRGDPRVIVYPSLTLEVRENKDTPGEILFNLPGPVSLDTIRILPREVNTFVKVKLFSRSLENQPWRQRAAGRVYRPKAQNPGFDQTGFSLSGIRDRYWKLETDGKGGGFGKRLPVIVASWQPHTLLFAARGGGPFTLAWGSRRAGTVSVTSDGLFAFQEDQGKALLSTRVALGEPYELGGTSALSAATPTDWKRRLLWGLLGLSAVLLSWMAWRTLKQISAA